MVAWYDSQSEAAVYRCLWLGIIFRHPFPHSVFVGSSFCVIACEHSRTSSFGCSLLFLCISLNKHVEPISHCALVRVCLRRSWQSDISLGYLFLEKSLKLWFADLDVLLLQYNYSVIMVAAFVCFPPFQCKGVVLVVCCAHCSKTMCSHYEQDNIDCFLQLGFPLQREPGFRLLSRFKT